MNVRRPVLIGLLTTMALISTPTIFAADSGTSHFISFDPPGAMETGCPTCALAINQSGEIAGSYTDPNNTLHGFVRSPKGKYIEFEAPGANTTPGVGGGTLGQGINDAGEVTGSYLDKTGVVHAYVLSPQGVFTAFDAPGAAGDTLPVYISAEGAVVGYALNSGGRFYAFLRGPDGNMVAFQGPGVCLGTPTVGCYGSQATYAGSSGMAVGNYADRSGNLVQHGLIRGSDGTLSTFDAPGAGTGRNQGTGCTGCNMGSNQMGTIAGIFTDSSSVFHGFTRSANGEFLEFDAPGAGTGSGQGTGCSASCPVGINDSGVITGSFQDANFTQHGFVRTDEGHFVTLDPPGTIFTQPEAINDSGVVVGFWVDANFVIHGFIWSP